MWLIFKFFWKFFITGFFGGLILRMIWFAIFRNKTTAKGVINTGILGGLIFCIIVIIGMYI